MEYDFKEEPKKAKIYKLHKDKEGKKYIKYVLKIPIPLDNKISKYSKRNFESKTAFVRNILRDYVKGGQK